MLTVSTIQLTHSQGRCFLGWCWCPAGYGGSNESSVGPLDRPQLTVTPAWTRTLGHEFIRPAFAKRIGAGPFSGPGVDVPIEADLINERSATRQPLTTGHNRP